MSGKHDSPTAVIINIFNPIPAYRLYLSLLKDKHLVWNHLSNLRLLQKNQIEFICWKSGNRKEHCIKTTVILLDQYYKRRKNRPTLQYTCTTTTRPYIQPTEDSKQTRNRGEATAEDQSTRKSAVSIKGIEWYSLNKIRCSGNQHETPSSDPGGGGEWVQAFMPPKSRL